eukprot:5990742-Prymnesium_polylepis.1
MQAVRAAEQPKLSVPLKRGTKKKAQPASAPAPPSSAEPPAAAETAIVEAEPQQTTQPTDSGDYSDGLARAEVQQQKRE